MSILLPKTGKRKPLGVYRNDDEIKQFFGNIVVFMKVVINERYGVFSLSDEAINKLIDKGVKITDYYKATDFFYPENEVFGIDSEDDKAWRADSRLVEVVEELGEMASGDGSRLSVVEFYPQKMSIIIACYDGCGKVER